MDAVRKQAFDYLLKPINRDDLQACARRILMHFYHHRTPGKGALSSAAQRLEILTSVTRHFVRHHDIFHIEAEGSYTTLHLASGRTTAIWCNWNA